jgi:hypothetical protein
VPAENMGQIEVGVKIHQRRAAACGDGELSRLLRLPRLLATDFPFRPNLVPSQTVSNRFNPELGVNLW